MSHDRTQKKRTKHEPGDLTDSDMTGDEGWQVPSGDDLSSEEKRRLFNSGKWPITSSMARWRALTLRLMMAMSVSTALSLSKADPGLLKKGRMIPEEECDHPTDRRRYGSNQYAE